MPPEKKKKTIKKRVPVKSGLKAGSGSAGNVAVKKSGLKAGSRSAGKSAPKVKKAVEEMVEEYVHDASMVPLVMYRRIALTFVVIVAFALISVLYLATMQAVIYVDPVETTLTSEYILSAVEIPTSETDVQAAIVNGTLGKTESYVPSGEGAVEIDEIATGAITIYNGLSFVQPLVVTTRFLTPEGVLFRLSEGTSVPAGGSVTAQVYADEAGVAGNNQPTRFSIPGLSAVRQELVYAESSVAFTGGVVTKSVVSQEEMEASAAELQATLLQDAQAMLRQEVGEEYSGELFDIEIVEKTFSIEPNTQADRYDVTLTISVSGIFYDREKLVNLAEQKLYEGLGQGQVFANIYIDEMEILLQTFSEEDGAASLKTILVGEVITSRANKALDVSRFVGMDATEVETILLEEGVAKSVRVEFFPFWVRSVPQLKDHIYIEIE